jgi:hypothetical protein
MVQNGNECGKSKGNKNLTAPQYRLRQLKNMEYDGYLGSITNYATCISELKFRIAMAKAAFKKNNNLFNSKLN